MLIISRRPDDKLHVSGAAIITVLSSKGNQVRLGITADPSVSVMREEVLERISQQDPDPVSVDTLLKHQATYMPPPVKPEAKK